MILSLINYLSLRHYHIGNTKHSGPVAQSVVSRTADPGVASLNLARSDTSVEIDHEIISTVILLPSADSRRVFVSKK